MDDKVLNEFLDQLSSSSAITQGMSIFKELEIAKQHVRDIEKELNSKTRQMLSALALEIQKVAPINSTINGDSMVIRYKSRAVTIKIDYRSKSFMVKPKSGNLQKRFVSSISSIPLTDEGFDQLSELVSSYFKSRYKTLRKDDVSPEDEIPINIDEIVNNL